MKGEATGTTVAAVDDWQATDSGEDEGGSN